VTRRQRAADELHATLEALDAIHDLIAEGRSAFDEDPDRRGHLSYLWIVVGSRLKNHCAVLDIPRATGRFAEAIAFRQKLAYTRPSKREDDFVWLSSVRDAPTLADEVRETLGALTEG
jgi:hypothetical protein